MMPRHLTHLAAALALAVTIGPANAETTSPDPYVPAGEPVDCLQLRSIQSTSVRDDQTIDFVTNGRKIYRNVLPNSCPSLGFERRFSYKTSLSQLCSVDMITVLYSGPGLQSGASCGLGKFQPMEKAAK
ncbi:MAG: hypothetical protein AB7E24_24565 [Novosphingobium sp.]